nr:hypothetical protein OG999_42270 [Streptomyces sp. NBC_00886]
MGPARVRNKETTTWAAPRDMSVTMAYSHAARHVAAMGQGDFEEAHAQVSQIDPPSAPGTGVPGRWKVLDLVEAAMRTGRREEARTRRRRPEGRPSPQLLGTDVLARERVHALLHRTVGNPAAGATGCA